MENKSNKCEYRQHQCHMPYEANRCINNYKECFVFQRFRALEVRSLECFVGSMVELPEGMKIRSPKEDGSKN